MPFLAALLGGLLTGITQWLAQFVTKKIAVSVALAAFFVAGWIALELALQALVVGLGYVTPGWMADPLSLAAFLLPSNLNACFSACISALFLRYVWDAQREWAKSVAAGA